MWQIKVFDLKSDHEQTAFTCTLNVYLVCLCNYFWHSKAWPNYSWSQSTNLKFSVYVFIYFLFLDIINYILIIILDLTNIILINNKLTAAVSPLKYVIYLIRAKSYFVSFIEMVVREIKDQFVVRLFNIHLKVKNIIELLQFLPQIA